MKTYLNSIIGTYTPTGDTFANADWSYIFSAIILVLSFWFIYKIVIGLFRK